jgi:hypothetical protein
VDQKAAWQHYYDHSGAASSAARKLGFTGIALVWIFSGGGTDNAQQVQIHGHYLWPLALLVLALAVDFVQYVYLAGAWWGWSRHRERHGRADVSEPAPHWINRGGEICWVVKIALVAVGYVWLLVALSEQLT